MPGLPVTVAGVNDDVLVPEAGPDGIGGIREVRDPGKPERVLLPDRPFQPRGRGPGGRDPGRPERGGGRGGQDSWSGLAMQMLFSYVR